MRPWLSLFAVLLALPAWAARSVAVLPLDQGAKSEVHEGLGRALAGMLVSDLSRVEDLELVERSRLDVLLKEIELGESGFLDPATAAKLGSGVGASWVIVGSWSVVGETFLMDARAVEVSSGKIVAAVDSNGRIDDFITVEKSLVEDLLAALSVAVTAGERRKIIAEAATEDFQAMTTYGAGLQAEFDGRYDEAKKRFEEAVQRDPEFDLPLERLASVRSALEALESTRVTTRADAQTQRLLDAVAKSPDEMKLTGRTTDPRILGQLSVRWAVLERLDRQCQIVGEMNHYLERHKGKLTDPGHPAAFNHRHWAAFDLGLYDERPEIWDRGTVRRPNSEFSFDQLVDRAPSVTRAGSMIVGITDGIDRAEEIGDSLLNLTVACAGSNAAARLSALEELLARIRRLGIDDDTTYTNSRRPVWTEVEIFVLQAMASIEGMSARVQQRSQVLMDLDLGDDDTYALRSDVSRVAKVAERTGIWKAVSDGLTEAEIREIAQAIASSDTSVLRLDDQPCAQMASGAAFYARLLVGDTRRAKEPWTLVEAAVGANTLVLAGCRVGRDSPFPTLAEALAWVDTMPKRAPSTPPEECAKLMTELAEGMNSYRTSSPQTDEIYRPIVIGRGMHVVRRGCSTIR